MRTHSCRSSWFLVGLVMGCASNPARPVVDTDAGLPPAAPMDAAGSDLVDAGPAPDVGSPGDSASPDGEEACAATSREATLARAPVDIIWVVDNSGSMGSERQQVRNGLNAFAETIVASGLDYRVIMLSARPEGGVLDERSLEVCVPPPLGGPNCTDGERYFHIDVHVSSHSPIEVILGTLAQTRGYREGDSQGGPPWRHLLREDATKTIVVVTDDDAEICGRDRECSPDDHPFTNTSLEDFPGGSNPVGGGDLGPGILTEEYGDLFLDYTFDAIYGWGDEADPTVACDGAASAGQTYTELVTRTAGVRAQVCEGASAWGPFFDEVASTVVLRTRIECEMELPEPPDGSVLDPDQVNVQIEGPGGTSAIGGVRSEAECDSLRGGWFYDNADDPTRVLLCPASCSDARAEAEEGDTRIEVLFGCERVLI